MANRRFATKRMMQRIDGDHLIIEFEDGACETWDLPNRSDIDAIKRLRTEAISWAQAHGATHPGQTNAVRKAFTEAGFYTGHPILRLRARKAKGSEEK
jgi:hypothetical protein